MIVQRKAVPLSLGFARALRVGAGVLILACGVSLVVSARILFKRTGQSPIRWKPTPELILRGPYRFTRNPMYVGVTLFVIGLGFAVNNLWISQATVQELDVPFYLHPRSPLANRQQSYEGYSWLAGSPWGFGAETSIHALRLMVSGLFDEYPKLKIILGHLGEGLTFGIWRVDHRISRLRVTPRAKLPMSHYLRENFYINDQWDLPHPGPNQRDS